MQPLTSNDASLVLNGLPGVGPMLYKRLQSALGDPLEALRAPEERLRSILGAGSARAIQTILRWPEYFDLAKEKALMHSSGVRFITQGEAVFPPLLQQIGDPPIGLYVKGGALTGRPTVGIVGSRHATLYGLSVARRFAQELAQRGFSIVSGMARGIDAAAHQGALDADGHTLAVLGSGINVVYPPENRALYEAIGAQGALVSEFTCFKAAERHHFPMRNRLVAGLSQVLIVVESDCNGGSMITARLAGDQGRPVFAVPGRIDQASSRGCHQLIRDGATLLTSIDELLEEVEGAFGLFQRPLLAHSALGASHEDSPAPVSGNAVPSTLLGPTPSTEGLSDVQKRILKTLREGGLLTLDQLAALTELPIPQVAAQLMALELQRRVVKRCDGTFEQTV